MSIDITTNVYGRWSAIRTSHIMVEIPPALRAPTVAPVPASAHRLPDEPRAGADERGGAAPGASGRRQC